MAQKNSKQKDLAKYAGISTSAISDWKKRGTNPSVDKIGLIADCLGVPVDYLLGRPIEPPKYNQTNLQVADAFTTLDLDAKTEVLTLISKLKTQD